MARVKLDLKEALKKKRETEVATLRLLLAELHNRAIALQRELTTEEVLGVVRREIRKREESIEAYRQGKRDDLVRKEERELMILKRYLPPQISPQKLKEIIEQTRIEVKAKDRADFGRLMKAVMGKVKGRVEGSIVAKLVGEQLGD